jgi:alkylation response protein AidB-like acyl-CoA dehydrogenase
MARQYSRRNLDFVLKEVLEVQELTKFPYFQDYSADMFDMVLDTAEDIAERVLRPAYTITDRQEPQLENGQVKVHPVVGQFLKAMGESDLISAPFSYHHGGQQLPYAIAGASYFIMGAAHNSVIMFASLSAGSSHLIYSFGKEELWGKFARRMVDGTWTGTMCLTEPQAGSALNDVITQAKAQPDGTYKIKGQKIFISAGDHDMTPNIIHLVLARLEGAPAGVKGISLFAVPKYRDTDNDGVFTVDNDVTSTGIYHKMGQKATPAMHLSFGENDNSIGWLVGEPNEGLKNMFQMMNDARLGVGLAGAYIGSAAYYAALEYANERPQGRRLNEKDPTLPPTLIINHPDVRRMLLFQKAVTEGCTSLILECYQYQDLIHAHGADTAEGKKYQMLLDLMTTVAKTFPAEMGIKSVNEALQVFGGYGYTEDFPLEQMARDVRIMTLYEGTTGIQSLTLLGRGITAHNGQAVQMFFAKIQESIAQAKTNSELASYADKLNEALASLQKVTMHLVGIAMKGDHELFLSDATLYMEFFGTVTVAWHWIKQALVAKNALITKNPTGEELAFYEGKIHTMKFYYHYELPKTHGLATRLTDNEALTLVGIQELV